jgi:hypothetical protein
MTSFLLTAAAIAVIMFAMGVGAIVNFRCLTGSCGRDAQGGDPLACAACPQRKSK